MTAFNKVVVAGNLVRDPELRQVSTNDGEVSVLNFTVAVNRPGTKNDAVDFLNCVAWRGLADTIAAYKKKGDSVLVEGALQTRTYEKENVTHYATDIVASNVVFLGNAGGNASSGGNNADDGNDENSDIPF